MLDSRIPPSNLQRLLPSNLQKAPSANSNDKKPDTRQAWEIEHEADRKLYDLSYEWPKEAHKPLQQQKQALKPSVSLAVEAALKSEQLKQQQESNKMAPKNEVLKKVYDLTYANKDKSRPVPAFKPDTRFLWQIEHEVDRQLYDLTYRSYFF